MKFVARIPRSSLDGGALVRVKYAPYDVLVALVEGAPCAIEDACNHAGASLAEGWREGDAGELVGCPMHGYLFDLRSGKLVSPKGLCADQREFTVIEEGEDVVIYDTAILTILT